MINDLFKLDKRHKWKWNKNADLECTVCHKIILRAADLLWYRKLILPKVN